MLNVSGLTQQDTCVTEVASPSLVPDQAIDRTHLFKMTLGDHNLQEEVLRLFERQAGMLLDRMAGADAPKVKALAHTLNGSARGIGAWRVAHAAQAVEEIAADPSGALTEPLAALRAATDEAVAAIADLLRIR
jgi:HPt (histidine-containing phosphotransfer) domain-containing protein